MYTLLNNMIHQLRIYIGTELQYFPSCVFEKPHTNLTRGVYHASTLARECSYNALQPHPFLVRPFTITIAIPLARKACGVCHSDAGVVVWGKKPLVPGHEVVGKVSP